MEPDAQGKRTWINDFNGRWMYSPHCHWLVVADSRPNTTVRFQASGSWFEAMSFQARTHLGKQRLGKATTNWGWIKDGRCTLTLHDVVWWKHRSNPWASMLHTKRYSMMWPNYLTWNEVSSVTRREKLYRCNTLNSRKEISQTKKPDVGQTRRLRSWQICWGKWDENVQYDESFTRPCVNCTDSIMDLRRCWTTWSIGLKLAELHVDAWWWHKNCGME